jgi:hypothetical protein
MHMMRDQRRALNVAHGICDGGTAYMINIVRSADGEALARAPA